MIRRASLIRRNVRQERKNVKKHSNPEAKHVRQERKNEKKHSKPEAKHVRRESKFDTTRWEGKSNRQEFLLSSE